MNGTENKSEELQHYLGLQTYTETHTISYGSFSQIWENTKLFWNILSLQQFNQK